MKQEKTDTNQNRTRILKTLGSKNMTANEIIEKMFKLDAKSGAINNRSWKYYVHCNKLFSPMEKAGAINHIGDKIGPTNKTEKIWSASC